MSITAKDLAKIMGLSEAAISMALNGKPGVSTETRKRVIETAHNYSYDFTKLKKGPKNSGTICYIVYRKYSAILKMQNTPFFEQHGGCLSGNQISDQEKTGTARLFEIILLNVQFC